LGRVSDRTGGAGVRSDHQFLAGSKTTAEQAVHHQRRIQFDHFPFWENTILILEPPQIASALSIMINNIKGVKIKTKKGIASAVKYSAFLIYNSRKTMNE